uniref:Tumor necrosis factor receptor member 16 transmembrane domain-containing protein n=1 Tax=Catharus ustulatus TaxID=91951 RepID=A0A8C3TTH8_CATUS
MSAPPSLSFWGSSDEAAAPLPEGTPPVWGDPRVTPPVSGAPPEAPPGDIIPLYCALLAALVVGLVAYVAFKWKKRQLDKARDTGDTGDVEKLRGDSGLGPESAGLECPCVPGMGPCVPGMCPLGYPPVSPAVHESPQVSVCHQDLCPWVSLHPWDVTTQVAQISPGPRVPWDLCPWASRCPQVCPRPSPRCGWP